MAARNLAAAQRYRQSVHLPRWADFYRYVHDVTYSWLAGGPGAP